MQKEFCRANVSCIWDYVNQTSKPDHMNDLDCNKSPEIKSVVAVKSVVDVSVVL